MIDAIFIGTGIFTIFFALAVVFAKEAAHSAFSLILTFFGLSTLYVLWGSNFIAMLQILIYAGAIVVLFVFVVMVLDKVKVSTLYSGSSFLVLVALGTVWTVSLLLLRVLNRGSFFEPAANSDGTNMKAVSAMLFGEYLWAFEILSVFLLALIIAVCVVAKPQKNAEKGAK